MAQYKNFIQKNVSYLDTKRIGIYNEQGNRIGFINFPLEASSTSSEYLKFPSYYKDKKKFSFGALSDVHIVYDTAADDFKRALDYLNNEEDVAFTCICGDLTDDGTAEQLAQYKTIVDSHSPDTPVYAIAGNHEAYNTQPTLLEQYTGKPLYYSFVYDKTMFIMCGCYSWTNDGIFTEEYLQWLYETLESNRDKYCFIFQHVMPFGDCGNPGGYYGFDMFSGTKGDTFLSLLRHYTNTVFFHGHSHTKFELQSIDEKANYSNANGYRSIHIPSLAVPRDIVNDSLSNIYSASEGYVVDVYPRYLHLRGRDFVKEEFLPIASYWIPLALYSPAAGTYTDPNGIIKT